MPSSLLDSSRRRKFRELLERGTRVLGLRLCYHDILNCTGLPKPWLQHENPACLSVKSTRQDECAAFCGDRVEVEIASRPDGSTHVCPFGHTDVVAPVWRAGALAGVLYAGACWTGSGDPPRPGLIRPSSRRWLEDRRVMLLALAKEMEALLQGDADAPEATRRDAIAAFLHARLDRTVRLADLAGHLHLSASRTGRVVRELFGETFPKLLTRLRLNRAARLLSITDRSAGDIALTLGFADQSHFTRAFTRHFGKSPLRYRREHRAGV